MTKISIDQFDKLIEYMKMVRSDFIAYYDGVVMGYDARLCMIKVVNASENFIYPELTFTASYTAVIAFRKTLLPTDEIIFDNNRIYAKMSECEYVPSNFTTRQIYNKYLELKYHVDMSSVNFGSLRGLDFIEAFLSSKAADGAIGVQVDERHKMYIPSNVLSVTKSDDLLLSVYDSIGYFISRFTIVKKKKIFIEVYIKFLTL